MGLGLRLGAREPGQPGSAGTGPARGGQARVNIGRQEAVTIHPFPLVPIDKEELADLINPTCILQTRLDLVIYARSDYRSWVSFILRSTEYFALPMRRIGTSTILTSSIWENSYVEAFTYRVQTASPLRNNRLPMQSANTSR